MRCWLRTPVELLQSSYTYGTTVRQGSRFATTLPYQAFNPFGVGEIWGDIWQVLQRRMAWKEWDLACQGGCMLYTGVSLARRAVESLELRIFDVREDGLGKQRTDALRRNGEWE